ncbi:hypothetical protein QBC46DRAFT_378628 [Diplogelasinospora grovesii]|uniref:HTH myb-type domain-containing protein n=1 Tax=Diplogelasinospora grovesii TaxID=303347 RepID=A0AAN6NC12_9PEZI|nr:hypothetical protein QBC46DRAFT_378628 [Diplogelasinospora grovesii]
MAIRDRWNRMISRKSVSSRSSSGGDTATTLTTATTAPTPAVTAAPAPTIAHARTAEDNRGFGSELVKGPSRFLAKIPSWRSKPKSPKLGPYLPMPPGGDKKKNNRNTIHPSERPLTQTNIHHQEMLSGFTLKFGRRRESVGARTTYSNVSPGCSRPGSIDMGGGLPDRRRISPVLHDVTREDSE